MTIASLRDAYAAGMRPVDVVPEVFERIAASPDPAVWITLRPHDDILRAAEALTTRPPADQPLWGIPFAVKDNIDVAGLPTTCACPPFAYMPERDAPVVARLRAAGALAIGKTNLDQFATGLVGVRSPHGAPRCVFNPEYIAGGSSSGSAVAVARGQVAFALGTDTAGSGRVPAAFNHIVGVKPSRGLLSTAGVVPASRSLDSVSVFAVSCAEADVVRRVAQGFDPDDPYSRTPRVRRLPLDGVTVGVLSAGERAALSDPASAACYAHALAAAKAMGWSVRDIDYSPFRAAAALLYDGAWVAERLAALEEVLQRHGDAVDPTVRAIVEGARRYSGADAFRAHDALASLSRRAEAVWAEADALLLPTTPTVYRVDEVVADPIRLNADLGRYTNFVNLLDCCAVAVPGGFRSDGLPFGVTLVAPTFADDDLAVLADRLHRALEPTAGIARAPLPPEQPAGGTDAGMVRLAVVGAHLTGQPLNWQLADRGGQLLSRTRTAATYRLFALPGTVPPKPGLLHDPTAGAQIEVEVWALSAEAFGTFVADVPPPLTIGTVTLADGTGVKGFLCESFAVAGGTEITAFGGWRAYLAARR